MLERFEQELFVPSPERLLVGEPALLRLFRGLPPDPPPDLHSRFRIRKLLFAVAVTMSLQWSPRVLGAAQIETRQRAPAVQTAPPFPPLVALARQRIVGRDFRNANAVPAGPATGPAHARPVVGATRMRSRSDSRRDTHSNRVPRSRLPGGAPAEPQISIG